MTNEQLIKKTQQLVAIPSTADNLTALRQAVDIVADMLKARPDLRIEHFERNGKPSFLAYHGPIRPAKFDILLNAHLDVVPAELSGFTPYIENGRLFGRGTLDMKGTAVVLTSVFSEMASVVPYALGLQIVSDEEVGGYDGVRYHIDEGVRSKFIIMGEYANERHTIYNAARGLCWTEILFKGKSAHGGHLWHGSNAILKAGNFAGAVLKKYPTPQKETWTSTASIASLSTPNETYNKVPDTAVLKIDFRFTQEDPVFENRASVEKFIASIDPEAELINIAVFEPAVNVEELNPYVQGLSSAMNQVTHTKPHFLGRPGGSDGRHYALVNNDTIEFGLYGKNPHSEGEYVELDSFSEYREILRKFLKDPLPAGLINANSKGVEPLYKQLLRQLVALRTITGNAAASNRALHIIEKFLTTRGMHVQRHESEGFGSLLATTKKDNKRPTVLLSAHIDVVPAEPEHFSVNQQGDKLYGRGVLDMKFAIASYLQLVDQLKDNLAAYDFGILITSDEEIGGRHGTNVFIEKGLRPQVAIIPDSAENWGIETFSKGVQWVKLEASGTPGHASRPWEGKNAISALLAALHDIEALAPPQDSQEATTLSIGTIEGGTAGNQIAAAASCLLDIRHGNLDDFQALYPRLQAICKQYDVQPTLLVSDPPCINDIDNPYIKLFRETTASVAGVKLTPHFSHGTTDGRYFSALNIPCIITAPEGGGKHTETEWVSEKRLEQFNTILEVYINQVATKQAPSLVRPTVSAPAQQQYVWYAMYGSGLSKENFLCYIRGGQPEGATINYPGCQDKSLPLKDAFLSLPYKLYFAGESSIWGGGLVSIHPDRDPKAHTIARAYLITLEQFTEIAAQHNPQRPRVALPFEQAIQHGHATRGAGKGNYEELVYCGKKAGWPIFTLTASALPASYAPPSLTYARLLCKGLSENTNLSLPEALNYILTTPGIDGHFDKRTVAKLFEDKPSSLAAHD